MSKGPLQNFLKKSLHNAGIAKQVQAAIIIDAFNKKVSEIFGTYMLEKARGLYVKDDALHISCAHSTVSQEIKFHESEIIDYVNKIQNSPKISKIFYHIFG